MTGCPVSACSGAGQTPIDTVPDGFGGRGKCVASGTSVSHRVSSGRLWPCNTFGTGRKAMSPFPLPPSSDSAVHSKTVHMGETLRPPPGGFLSESRSRSGRGVVWWEGSASLPFRLAARVWAPHACVSDSWSNAACVLFGLARLAPVRHRLADPPICLSDARIALHRMPSSFAGGGRRRARVCERKWKVPY
jgi:hypothetical protein